MANPTLSDSTENYQLLASGVIADSIDKLLGRDIKQSLHEYFHSQTVHTTEAVIKYKEFLYAVELFMLHVNKVEVKADSSITFTIDTKIKLLILDNLENCESLQIMLDESEKIHPTFASNVELLYVLLSTIEAFQDAILAGGFSTNAQGKLLALVSAVRDGKVPSIVPLKFWEALLRASQNSFSFLMPINSIPQFDETKVSEMLFELSSHWNLFEGKFCYGLINSGSNILFTESTPSTIQSSATNYLLAIKNWCRSIKALYSPKSKT